MQILMTKAAHGRVGEQIAKIAPDADVVTVADGEVYERNGQPADVAGW